MDYLPIKFGTRSRQTCQALLERPTLPVRRSCWRLRFLVAGSMILQGRRSSELYAMTTTRTRCGGKRRSGCDGSANTFGEKVIPSASSIWPIRKYQRRPYDRQWHHFEIQSNGTASGLGSGNVVMIREGTMVDHDPNASEPKRFRVPSTPTAMMRVVEGLNVFTSDGIGSIRRNLLPGAASYHRPDGVRKS